MRLTKYTHSCVTVEKGDRKLVLDPGSFSELDPALDGADAILITHEHADHVDVDRVRAALVADDALTVYAPAAVAEQFADLGERVSAVVPGQSLDVSGFTVRTFGGQHALIHPRIPVVANVGYLVDDDLFHPGDSFTVPETPVRTLLVPVSAPWSKTAEVIDYTIAVRPPRALPIHEAVASVTGLGMINGHVARFSSPFGVEYTPVEPGTSIEL